MQLLRAPFLQPLAQLLQPRLVIAEFTLIGVTAIQESHVETVFRNVDAKNLMVHVYALPLIWFGHASATVQPCELMLTSLLLSEGHKMSSELEQITGERELIWHTDSMILGTSELHRSPVRY